MTSITMSAQPEDPAMKTALTRLLTATVLALSVHAAFAAGGDPTPADTFAPVRVHLAAKQWTAAIDELKRINEPASADWNNLMGYSLRKAKTPDFAAAEKHYSDALRIDPKHRGALSYSGELYLMTGNLALAEQRLGALDKICFLPCSEFTALKKAVERYKAAGNKYDGSY
jgi:Flp pilus assembly protein TadD